MEHNDNNIGEIIAQFFNNRDEDKYNEIVENKFQHLLRHYESPEVDALITDSIFQNSIVNNLPVQEVLGFNVELMSYRSLEQKQDLWNVKKESGLMWAASHLPQNEISQYFDFRSPKNVDTNDSNELHICAMFGQTEAIEYLSKQSDKHEYFTQNKKGDTPINFCFNGQELAPERANFIVNNFVDANNPQHMHILNKEKSVAIRSGNEFLAQILTIGRPVPFYPKQGERTYHEDGGDFKEKEDKEQKAVTYTYQNMQNFENKGQEEQESGILGVLKTKILAIREAAGFGPSPTPEEPKDKNRQKPIFYK